MYLVSFSFHRLDWYAGNVVAQKLILKGGRVLNLNSSNFLSLALN